MKKVLKGVVVLTGVAVIAAGAAMAFFTDVETSTGNSFTAGAIDLEIDNESYYNGVYSEETSWELTDLTDEVFFDFEDLKPGDWGEDTLSLHVDTNDAWVCVDLVLTANDDVDCNDPELVDDPSCEVNMDLFDGELAQEMEFIFWLDDGDNVLEDDEELLTSGTAYDVLNGVTLPIADSTTEYGPLVASTTYYIGKAWCFGNLTLDPVPAGQGVNPTVAPGILCDGSGVSNAPQTDMVMADFTFRAIQSRNNMDYECVD